MMKRKYLNDLIAWNNDPDKKPLMIWGARQVGKSYLVEELFAKKYYQRKYLKIDCSNEINFVNFVMENSNLSDVLKYIEANYNFKADKDHLLIFDEAQDCIPVIKMMKHFCELRRDIPVIVTGSLVRLKILREAHKRGNYAQNSQFLFPVGKINQIYMYPLTFDEFLFNYNEALYDIVKTHYINKTQMECVQHKKLLDLINDYLFVGGMPEAVDAYLKNKDNINVYKIVTNKIKEIYDNYLADMDLYQASSESIVRSRLIYNDIYRQLNKENKNFKFSLTQEGAKGRDMINPIGWLTLAKIVNQSFLLKERITLPLIKEEDSLTRLYLSDVGMFTYQSGLNAKSFITNKDNSLSGIYYENFIASELSARNIGLFYWKGKRNAEFEFIISYDQKVIPIDVKKGKDKLNSLKEFREHNKNDLAIKISSNQYGYNKENKILTLPFYYVTFFLNDLINDELVLF